MLAPATNNKKYIFPDLDFPMLGWRGKCGEFCGLLASTWNMFYSEDCFIMTLLTTVNYCRFTGLSASAFKVFLHLNSALSLTCCYVIFVLDQVILWIIQPGVPHVTTRIYLKACVHWNQDTRDPYLHISRLAICWPGAIFTIYCWWWVMMTQL